MILPDHANVTALGRWGQAQSHPGHPETAQPAAMLCSIAVCMLYAGMLLCRVQCHSSFAVPCCNIMWWTCMQVLGTAVCKHMGLICTNLEVEATQVYAQCIHFGACPSMVLLPESRLLLGLVSWPERQSDLCCFVSQVYAGCSAPKFSGSSNGSKRSLITTGCSIFGKIRSEAVVCCHSHSAE